MCPSMDEWVNKMEYCSAIKKKEILPFVRTWMDLEGIMLSQKDKDKYCMISLTCGILKKEQKQKQIHRNRSDLWLP